MTDRPTKVRRQVLIVGGDGPVAPLLEALDRGAEVLVVPDHHASLPPPPEELMLEIRAGHEESMLDHVVREMPWRRRLWWRTWDARLSWWLDSLWSWVTDAPYWEGFDGEPYLVTRRTRRRVEPEDDDWDD